MVEKTDSVFADPMCSEESARKVILAHPYDCFRTMQVLILNDSKTEIQINPKLWQQITPNEKEEIENICNQKLSSYFAHLS